MADMKTEFLISIPAGREEEGGSPTRSIDYIMFNAALFFVPTVGLVMFESNWAAAQGVPAAAREKVDQIFPLYGAIIAFSIVTVIFTWMFRTSGMSRSAGILNCINGLLVCISGPMLVWQLLTLQAYHFFAMLAVAIVICSVIVIVSERRGRNKA